MKKELIALIFIFILFISGCGITGKGVINPENQSSKEKIDECVKLCNDNSKTEEEFYNSCSSILKYGGEKVFNDYMESCR